MKLIISDFFHPAFGSPMPTRTWNDPNAKYKYGFNGMEKDDDISGEGNEYTTEFRQYSSRIGRWFSLDPLTKAYESHYASFSNTPISKIDPDGNSDYYTADGEYLGSDGTCNTDIHIVTDAIVIEQIRNSPGADFQNNIKIYSATLPDGTFFTLPPYSERQEIKKTMETQKADARNEVGGMGYKAGDGSTYLAPAFASPPATDSDLKTCAKHELHGLVGTNPLTIKDVGDPADADALKNWKNIHKNSGTSYNYTWHDHPFIVVTELTEDNTGDIDYIIGPNQKKNGWTETGRLILGGDASTSMPRAQPSVADQEAKGSYSNFVISKAAGRVTQYNRKNTTTTMKLDFFYSVKARNTSD